ncbi:hypothetical protein [Shimia sp.]|uniref:hypothetical protein n=1 Tax=Shimia sp. TaxID=1954381 RepID=UPI003BA86DEE
MSRPKASNYTPPAPAPAPPVQDIATRELGSEERPSEAKRRKKGRQSLRIDPQTGGVSSRGGAGINIPMK